MITPDDRDLRLALRTMARPFLVDAERRGIRFRLHDGKVQARPRALLTDLDRFMLRAHAVPVRVLVARRPDWSDWATRPMPRFDPSRAFLADDELRKRGAA